MSILIQQKWKSRSRSRMLELTRNRPLIGLVHDVKVNSAVLLYCYLFGKRLKFMIHWEHEFYTLCVFFTGEIYILKIFTENRCFNPFSGPTSTEYWELKFLAPEINMSLVLGSNSPLTGIHRVRHINHCATLPLYYVDYGNYQLCPQNTLKLKLNKSMSSSHSIEYIIYVKQLVFNAVSVWKMPVLQPWMVKNKLVQ